MFSINEIDEITLQSSTTEDLISIKFEEQSSSFADAPETFILSSNVTRRIADARIAGQPTRTVIVLVTPGAWPLEGAIVARRLIQSTNPRLGRNC